MTLRLTAAIVGVIFAFLNVAFVNQGPDLPILKTTTNRLDYQVGDETFKNKWLISPETKPDVLTVFVPEGQKVRVTFKSDQGELSFDVQVGQSIDFNIVMGQDVCWTRIVGIKFTPAARYDTAYQAKHRNKIEATVPEVYELINVAIGLTDYSRVNKWIVLHNTDYGKEMMAWFAHFQKDPLILALDKRLKSDGSAYSNLKMNGNAFVFDKDGKIVPRKEYARTGPADEKTNTLEPYIAELSRFAKESRFREFYRAHKPYYDKLCEFFLKEAGTEAMVRWLEREFPQSPKFDFVDIVFSPLVGGNQSSTWFESNGFRTLQPHVNYPFPEVAWNLEGLTPQGEAICKGFILFTEMNHGFLTPASDVYHESVLKAIRNTNHWISAEMSTNYADRWLFDEYMNWGLIPLLAQDFAPKDADRIMKLVISIMKQRGFVAYDEFQPFLMQLYRDRKPGQTVWDLYPQILRWFSERNEPVVAP